MHTNSMPDSAGLFDDWKASDIPHRDCGGEVKYRMWESSCGGYEDFQFNCTKCNKTWWVEGSDS